MVPGETITITFERNKGWDKPAYTATFEVGGKEVPADMTTDENVATATITVPADIDDGDVVLKSVAPKA